MHVIRRKSKRRLQGAAQAKAAVAASRDPVIYCERLKGKTERQIAREMGVSQPTVHGAIERCIVDQRASNERHRELMVGRVARLFTALLPLADGGDKDAARTVLLAEKRLADLLGLDAAKKHELTAGDGQPLIPVQVLQAWLSTKPKPAVS
jgi:hypothetical protein